MNVRAAIFDLDDTLYPERSFVDSGFHTVAQAFAEHLGKPADQLLDRMRELQKSPRNRRVFHVIAAESGCQDAGAVARRMVRTYRTHVPQIELFPDARRALDWCRGRYRLGLLSDGYLAAQNAKLDGLGVRDRFDAIVLTDEWGSAFWKPHPRGYEAVGHRLGLPPDALVYISDNPVKDFVACNRLGWHSIRIRRPDGVYADAEAGRGGDPEHTITSLDELPHILFPLA
jgi:putative hydrolase of the HAD superfamily